MPAPSASATVPPVNARVDVWFDGYDEYYPGRVERIINATQFHVILDDGTSWDIDVRRHVFKLASVGKTAVPDAPTPAQPTPSKRRSSGRAFRKNTSQKAVERDYGVVDDEGEKEKERERETVVRRRSSRVEGLEASKKEREAEREAEKEKTTPPRTRPRRGVTPAPEIVDVADVLKAKRARRKEIVEEEEPLEEEERASKKRKVDTVTTKIDTVAELTPQAVTAIAVDAALESAKAVIKPISERLDSLVNEIGKITETATKAASMAAEVHKKPWNANAITGAALENFQLDVSEIIGGGEARIKAYSGLTQHEFDSLHRIIEQQQRALKELDRLLYAAKEFARRGSSVGAASAAKTVQPDSEGMNGEGEKMEDVQGNE